MNKIYYHLPGLFEFYDFYKEFLKLYHEHRDYFYDWCEIGSIYGAPQCLWGGGRLGYGQDQPHKVIELLNKYHISGRLTFSNSLLEEQHLNDNVCNKLCELFTHTYKQSGIIIYSDLLLSYIKKNYPSYYFVSSTTKVITDFNKFKEELNNDDYQFVVPDFRLNKQFNQLETLTSNQKSKVEFLVNEACFIGCNNRKACYQNVSRQILGEDIEDFKCTSPDASTGYLFSKAMNNPSFISIEDIQNIYQPLGFNQFKIEGRDFGNAILLEFILYYMTKPQYHILVREALYLDTMLDLF